MAPYPDETCPVCCRSYNQSSGDRTRRKLIGNLNMPFFKANK